MKKRRALIVSIALVLPIFLIWLAGCAPASPQKTESDVYRIEQITPGIIRVIGIPSNSYKENGYGLAFSKAIEEISEKYEIEEITPINYHVGAGSATKELIIRVKLKR